MKHRAFTLWEVLFVVTIIGILAAILFPTLSNLGGTPYPNKHRSQCISNLKQMGLGLIQYTQDYDGKAPPISNARGGWRRLVFLYVRSETVFRCPAARGDKTGATDYFFNARLAGANGKLSLNRNAKSVAFTILSGDGADDADVSANLSQFPNAWRTDESSPAWRHLDGANYLFIDGHVKWFKPEKITLDKPSANQPTFLAR